MGTKLLRVVSLPLRLLTALASLYILAISAYHVERVHRFDLTLSGRGYAIIVISGVGILYSSFTLFSGFLPHFLFILFIPLEIILCGGFIAVSVLLRSAAEANCSNPGSSLRRLWSTSGTIYQGNVRPQCEVDKGAFAVAIANAVLYLLLAITSYAIFRHHRRNRAFGPGPSNNYGTGRNAPVGATGVKRGRFIWGGRSSRDAAGLTEKPQTLPGVETEGYGNASAGAGGFDPEVNGYRGDRSRHMQY